MAQDAFLTDQALLAQNPEASDISRQRKLAEMLTLKAFEQPQGNLVSGRYVAPSWTQQLAPLVSGIAGQAMGKNLDEKQLALAEALRGKQAKEIQQYGQLEQQDKPAALQFALQSNNPILRDIAKEELKGITLKKGDIYTKTSLGGGTTTLQGNPDLPESIQYAISVGQLPQNPKDWNSQQADYARQLVESKGAAGAGRNITFVGNKSIAERVGPIMEKEQEKTLAANKIFDSASNLTRALDTNKIYTGTGANVRLNIAQLANTAGFGGNTLEEKIANTRTGIQSLAQLTLQGRKEMKGEGAIQVQESALAERAISGDINFTPVELKILANAAQRSAKYTQEQYDRKLKHMASDKETAGLVPYFEVPPMQPIGSGSMPNQSAIDAEIARRQGKR
jgi:hypothetical protein